MAKFGKTSMSRLEGVHPLLVDWAFRLVTVMDCSVIYGVRTLSEQRVLVEKEASMTMDSYHLIQPDGYGHALDLAPYPIDWNDYKRFYVLIGMGLMLAHDMGIPITNGRDWDGDLDFDDQSFNDFLHWQIPRGLPI